MYELRDRDGRFVERARGRVAAHRASRRARHVGSSVNRLLPHSARVFKPSESFSAIVRTGMGSDDTIIVTYQGPSLSTARVKAKIAADQWKKPVDVIDEHWRKIATYGPGSA